MDLCFTQRQSVIMKISKVIMLLLLFTFGSDDVYAETLIDYAEALKLYKAHHYKKAFPAILKEAKEGDKEAQYLLASMYENGYGVQKDTTKALHWYKEASSTFKYIVKQDENTTVDEEDKALQYAYAKFDLSDPYVKKEVSKLTNKNFGILPYKTSYFLPLSYSSKKYPNYEKNTEIEFQISMMKNLTYNLFGFNEIISVAYTQKSFWQAYSKSAPFRETNYEPEIFITFPTPHYIDAQSHIKAFQFGFNHQSNGQEKYKSRSWNRLMFSTLWQWKNLFLKARLWYRIPESKKSKAFYEGRDPDAKGDDNPDIEKYLGYGDVNLKYLYKENQFGLKIRNNLRTSQNKGSVAFTFSRPVYNFDTIYWYIKYFNGYGESLIDYNRNVSKIGFGISLYRGLF